MALAMGLLMTTAGRVKDEVYVVPLPGTARLAEDDSGPDPLALVPVLAF
jgi:hypothetical protein